MMDLLERSGGGGTTTATQAIEHAIAERRHPDAHQRCDPGRAEGGDGAQPIGGQARPVVVWQAGLGEQRIAAAVAQPEVGDEHPADGRDHGAEQDQIGHQQVVHAQYRQGGADQGAGQGHRLAAVGAHQIAAGHGEVVDGAVILNRTLGQEISSNTVAVRVAAFPTTSPSTSNYALQRMRGW